MILSAYLGDRATFDGLWDYAKSHFDANGLMNWRIDANNNTVGFNAATDADEDMALALVVADRHWGGYSADAKAMIGKIMAHEIEPGTFVVKPGDVFGGSSLLNPSYFAPGYYREFATYTGDSHWNKVVDEVYSVLGAIDAKNNGTGLVPDWSDAAGDPSPGWGYDYSYNATRTPWRLATSFAWTGDARAKAQLDQFNAFFQGQGIANIKDGYTITGSVVSGNHNAAFVAPAASASLASTDSAYRAACWQATVGLTGGGYYNDSLRLLGLLLMGGQMTNPA
jgi:endo-1,4-beta-D-glucanase Y